MGTHGSGAARVLLVSALLVAALAGGASTAVASQQAEPSSDVRARIERIARSRVTQEQREAAAERLKLAQAVAGLSSGKGLSFSSDALGAAMGPMPMPGGVPDYFGLTPNWAFSPPLRKFVDGLPGLGASGVNNLGQYISVAKPDTVTYPGADYYEIELRQYEEQMHSDMPPTTMRGYVQTNLGTDGTGHNTIAPDPIHYMGPFIQARKGRPVRIKFTNALPLGVDGDLFIPVDTSVMGAGMGPLGMGAMPMNYTQNRATLHLHGGITPWISDGTPHQWITPAGEMTPYPKGVSVQNVPDMPDPGDGSMTFFYSNQQSARLMFYHDHTYGITRLNVYAGEAAGYSISDPAEDTLVANGTIPADQIPLVIQDKTFVDAATVRMTDPTWNWGTGSLDATTGIRAPKTGDLWIPHVYVPAQNPAMIDGINPTGRWHYGPWFWPPIPASAVEHGPIANPYASPSAPWEYELMPATPNPSMGMEMFHDTPLVNGTAYPVLNVDPKSYRLRILNAANDRFFNLQMYVADAAVTTSDGRTNTEVKMIPAQATPGFPELWPTDGRDGGVPDPTTAGPEWIQIGTEGGFLPKPAVIPQQPITWNYDPTMFNFGNVQDHSLLIAPAERADVVVDFSAYAGKTLILYNDSPAAFPARDPRVDYFTGNGDYTDTGGTTSTQAGFGPNIRTIMQIKVAAAPAAPAFDLAALEAAFASTATQDGVFKSSQNPIIIPDSRYDSAYNATFAADPYVRIFENSHTFTTLDARSVTMDMEPKAIQDETGETWDPIYGRMSGKLGLEMPWTNATNANFIMYGYIDPPTENLDQVMTPLSPVGADGTQIWKITHNGVDTHPIHWHLFDVQVINRVGWDGFIRPPDDNELGWKDTVRVSPLEDTIVALRPITPKLPFGLPDSIRPLDPTMPATSTMYFSNIDPETGQRFATPVVNDEYNFGWEYMWHCHILSHEEMEMMRPIAVTVERSAPATPSLAATGLPGAPIVLNWLDGTPVGDPATLGDPRNEIGFKVMRATVNPAGVVGTYSQIGTTLANATTFTDPGTAVDQAYAYRVFAYNVADETGSNVVRVSPPGYFAQNIILVGSGPGGRIVRAGVGAGAIRGQMDVTLDSEEVTSGADSSTFLIQPDPHYHIVDVFVDGVSVGPVTSYQFTDVLVDHTLYAIFALDTFAITPSVGTGGAISPSTVQTVEYGSDSATFTITPSVGYHIADVLVDSVSQGALQAYAFRNVSASHTIHAVFAVNTYDITPSGSGNGTITPNAVQSVNHGSDSALFTMTPDPGHRIADVLVDGASVGPVTSYRFVNVTAPHTIAVAFVTDDWVYRFYNSMAGTHFFTASADERDQVIATLGKVYHYEGLAFRAHVGPGGIPVYRFYNIRAGTHFYTASADERDQVIATLSHVYRFEGEAFQSSPAGANTQPVYRLYNARTGTHFYTISATERDSAVGAIGSPYSFEGVAFHAPR